MSSPLGATLETTERAERSSALRHLLRRPLILLVDDPELFPLLVRHRSWLIAWFAEQTGWKLIIDPAAGFARLHKVAARPDATRPARLSGKPAFDRRRYVLLCLTLAALDDSPSQTTVRRLAELLGERSREESSSKIEAFDPDRFAERRAFVDVLRWLVEVGLLRVRDGDAERYVHDREGDALYDIDDRLLSQMIAAPVPPSLVESPRRLLQELYPATEEGERQRARRTVMRALVDDPVLYYEDLGSGEYEWLDQSRGFVYRLMETDLGLRVERRREGLAAVDPAGELSDTLFPDGGSTVKHAALLLAELLTGLQRREQRQQFSDDEIGTWVADVMVDYGELCNWSKQYPNTSEGAAALARDAVALLSGFDLVAQVPGGWRLRPAIARFASAAPKAIGGS